MLRNEKHTRIDLINPKLFDQGWGDALIREEKTPGGTDIIDGKPRKRKGRTDYLLCLPVIAGKPPVAVVLDYNEYKRLKEIEQDKIDYDSAMDVKKKNKKWTSHNKLKKDIGL